MMMRLLGFSLGGLMAVLCLLVFYTWSSFNAEQTASSLKQYFKQNYQRNVLMAGAPQLRVWPRPALLLNRVSLSEPGRAQVFASAEQMRIDLAIIPLLWRQYEVTQIRVSNLALNLSRTPAGVWNLSALLAAPPAKTPSLPWQLNLEGLSVRGARVRIEGLPGAAKRLDWQDVLFDLSGLREDSPAKLIWQGRWLDDEQGDFKFKASARYQPAEDLSSGQLSNVSLNLEGDYPPLQGASVQLGAARLAWQAWGAQIQSDILTAKLQAAAGSQSLNFTASLPRIAWDDGRITGDDAQTRLMLRAVGQEAELKLAVSQLQASERGFQSDELTFNWADQRGVWASKGQLKGRLQVDLRSPAIRLENIQGDASLQHPRLRTPALAIKLGGTLQWRRGGSLDSALDVQSGENRVQWNAQLSQLWPLNGRFDLSSQQLFLDQLLAPSGKAAQPDRLNFPNLEDIALAGKLDLNNLRVAGVQIKRLQAPVSIEKGVLSSKVSLDLYAGQLAGSLTADSRSGRISTQGDFHKIELEPLLHDCACASPLSGPLSGTYKLSLQANTDKPALAGLEGAVRWTLENATLQGVDLPRSLREFRPAIQAKEATARSTEASEKTELGRVSSRFVLAEGKLEAAQIDARNRWLNLTGQGQVDMLQGTQDFTLQATVLPGVAAADTKDLADLRTKSPLRLQLKGPLMQPDLRFTPPPSSARPQKK